MSRADIRICGLNAVQASFAAAPDDIRRIYFVAPLAPRLGALCKHLARHHRPYRQTTAEELEGIAGTVHHGGVVAVVDPPQVSVPTSAEIAGWAAARLPLLLLDRIGNPHNLGAIFRSAAFFGVSRAVLSEHPAQAGLSDAVYRVSEGGAAFLRFYRTPSLAGFCMTLRPHYRVIAATLDGAPLPALTAALGGGPADRPRALILGNEEDGVDPAVAAAAEHRVTIPGAGTLQSLNVAASAAILIHALLVPPLGAGQAPS